MQRHRITKLTEDQISILLYCLNDGQADGKYGYEDLVFIKPKIAFERLQAFASKIKPEHVGLMQSIVDTAIS